MNEAPKFSPEAGKEKTEAGAEKREEKILEDVIFRKSIKRSRGQEFIEYRSDAPDRKIIILKENFFKKPEADKTYRVRIIEDTKPDDPLAGKFIAEIVFTPEEQEEMAKAPETRGKEEETIEIDEKTKEARIGRERTPIFQGADKKLLWNLEGEQFREQGQTMTELYFKRNDGVEIRPGSAPAGEKLRFGEKERFIPFNDYKAFRKDYPGYQEMIKNLAAGDAEKKEEAEKYLKEFKEKHPESEWALRALRHLNSLAVAESKEIIESDPDYEETPYNVETLEKFTRLINHQRERKQGIVIIEGEAGTGKNKDASHFAFLTRRPLFRFVCAPGKDEQDLKYLLEFDPKKGTYRIKSTIAEALQTPWAVLLLDEINTLKPEVAKSVLNPLLDEDRALFLGEDRKKIPAAEEVVIVGLQNPQHYMGVKPLAETIKSRARIMEKNYPPFKGEKTRPDEPTQYRTDEAMIIRRHVPELKDFTKREFQMLWDWTINEKHDPYVVDLITVERMARLEEIKEIVGIANKIRQAYAAYHEGQSDEPIKFVFSLRESVECGYELAHVKITEEEQKRGITRAKKAVSEVILPKVPVGEERTYLAKLIREL